MIFAKRNEAIKLLKRLQPTWTQKQIEDKVDEVFESVQREQKPNEDPRILRMTTRGRGNRDFN